LGDKTAALHIVSNAYNTPLLDVQLTGTGAVPQHSLTANITGNGTISNITQPPAFSCSEPTCTNWFDDGTPLTLRVTPSQLYVFGGWSGAGCSGTADCSLTLTTDATVNATFSPLPLVQIDGSSTPYLTFTSALADAAGSVAIKARNVAFSENITLDRSIDIVLTGGFQEDFSTVNGVTRLQGTLAIRLGSLKVGGLAIR
jgi:hypothetical protein